MNAGGDGDPVTAAVAFLLRSTQSRPQTEAELRDKLRKREVPTDVAERALDRARQLGAADDAAFARAWVADRGVKRAYGTARLRAELHRRLVPDELIETALAALQERNEQVTATQLASKRAAGMPASLEPPAVARRLQGYLVRRGYAPALAQRVAIDVSGLDRYRSWD
ncbi:MAG: recombination regulator RecX [Chloroflexota bacterium]|nr:recombination regulator RecX [Chloroflexota bacterium]